MRLIVDPGKCQGHTLCWINAPDLFELDDDDGHSTAIEGPVPAGREGPARDAVDACPERAISLVSD